MKAQYLQKQCNNGNSKDFWQCMKPMLSHKNNGSKVNISLMEDGTVLNDKNEIVYVVIRHFLSAAKGIDKTDEINSGFVLASWTHDSVDCIRENVQEIAFSPVTENNEGFHHKLS